MGSNLVPRYFYLDQTHIPKTGLHYGAVFQQCLTWALKVLGNPANPLFLAEIAHIILHCMTGRYRSFHTPEHVLQVVEGGDAIEVLAALFHDVVYIQVDTCIPPILQPLLDPLFTPGTGYFRRLKNLDELNQDPHFALVASIFDIDREEEYIRQQNEFLSAIVAVHYLHPVLNRSILAQVIACIEATIPFRVSVDEGISPSDRLYHNLQQANERFDLNLTEQDVIGAVKRAVSLANRDVKNFADFKASHFLDNTWKLLPETNPALRNPQTYTPLQYRCALQKMVGLMDFLQPNLVFREFQGEPSLSEYQQMLDRAEKNIEVARLYLKSKLVAIAFVEALNHPEREDTPLIALVGNVNLNPLSELEPFEASISSRQAIIETEVMDLLEVGRSQETAFDIRHSPLATLLARTYGFEAINQWFEAAQSFFKDQISHQAFLRIPPEDAVYLCLRHLKQH